MRRTIPGKPPAFVTTFNHRPGQVDHMSLVDLTDDIDNEDALSKPKKSINHFFTNPTSIQSNTVKSGFSTSPRTLGKTLFRGTFTPTTTSRILNMDVHRIDESVASPFSKKFAVKKSLDFGDPSPSKVNVKRSLRTSAAEVPSFSLGDLELSNDSAPSQNEPPRKEAPRKRQKKDFSDDDSSEEIEAFISPPPNRTAQSPDSPDRSLFDEYDHVMDPSIDEYHLHSNGGDHSFRDDHGKEEEDIETVDLTDHTYRELQKVEAELAEAKKELQKAQEKVDDLESVAAGFRLQLDTRRDAELARRYQENGSDDEISILDKAPVITSPPPKRNVPQDPLLSNSNNWKKNFSWSQKVAEVRQRVFGISSWRGYQEEVINATLSKKDVFIIMPTGAGKSLCYQLPGLIEQGITLVISPLLSLIQDQVMSLKALEIEAEMLTSAISKQKAKAIMDDLSSPRPRIKFLYVTPEKISKSKGLMSKLEKLAAKSLISRIAIDEAHCCSQWGHDFRPDYMKLGQLRRQLERVPILALTATATTTVLTDVKKILGLSSDCVFFRSSFNRPNLYVRISFTLVILAPRWTHLVQYEVRPKSSKKEQVTKDICTFINKKYGRRKESGIIYCLSRKECEDVAVELQKAGIRACVYHSSVSAGGRE
ncbi:putative DNA helicase recq1, partial [Planoprotostelium fungivorum]